MYCGLNYQNVSDDDVMFGTMYVQPASSGYNYYDNILEQFHYK